MLIRPISSVSFNNYNSLAFEGRKNKEHHNNASNPLSHKLAVPTAALMLAMMPMNGSSKYDRDVDNLNNIEYVEDAPKVVQRALVKDASPKYGDCIMDLVVNPDGKTGYMLLNFDEKTKYNGFVNDNGERKKIPMIKTVTYSIEVDTLKSINDRYTDGMAEGIVLSSKYVCGPVTIKTKFSRDNESQKVEETRTKKLSNMNIEISEDFYNSLKSFLGDRVNYKTENKTSSSY